MDTVKNSYIQSAKNSMSDIPDGSDIICAMFCCMTIVLCPVGAIMMCYALATEGKNQKKLNEVLGEFGLVPATGLTRYAPPSSIGHSPKEITHDSGFASMTCSRKITVYDEQECFWFWAPIMCDMDSERFRELFTTTIELEEEDYANIFILEAGMLPDSIMLKDKLKIKKALSVLAPQRSFKMGSSKSKSGMSDKQKAKLAVKGGEVLGDMISNFV